MGYPSDAVSREAHQSEFPETVVLCGSTRFRAMFDVEARRLTLEDVIVLGPQIWPHNGDSITDEQKARLDWLHLHKIDLADRVHVINVNGYVGESTRREIEYATRRQVPVTYLELTQDETDEE